MYWRFSWYVIIFIGDFSETMADIRWHKSWHLCEIFVSVYTTATMFTYPILLSEYIWQVVLDCCKLFFKYVNQNCARKLVFSLNWSLYFCQFYCNKKLYKWCHFSYCELKFFISEPYMYIVKLTYFKIDLSFKFLQAPDHLSLSWVL